MGDPNVLHTGGRNWLLSPQEDCAHTGHATEPSTVSVGAVTSISTNGGNRLSIAVSAFFAVGVCSGGSTERRWEKPRVKCQHKC